MYCMYGKHSLSMNGGPCRHYPIVIVTITSIVVCMARIYVTPAILVCCTHAHKWRWPSCSVATAYSHRTLLCNACLVCNALHAVLVAEIPQPRPCLYQYCRTARSIPPSPHACMLTPLACSSSLFPALATSWYGSGGRCMRCRHAAECLPAPRSRHR